MMGVLFLIVILSFLYLIIQNIESKDHSNQMWEILVPASNKDQEFSYDHHKEWDLYVKSLAGGLTIMKTAKGEWLNAEGKLYIDRVIPVRIKCKKKHIKKIIEFTIKHYNQEAVLAYKISDDVVLAHKTSTGILFERKNKF
jgi:hypothetical protein